MSLNRVFPNQYFSGTVSATSTVNSGSTNVLGNTFDFGYQMAFMKVIIAAAGPAYLQLNGQPATTNDYQLSTGDLLTDWYDMGTGLNGISIAATSTGMQIRFGAWG